MESRSRNSVFALLLCGTTVAFLLAASIYQLRRPIRKALQIRVGEPITRVHQLLGEPTLCFQSDAELRRSNFRSRSFVYTKADGTFVDVSGADLPPANGRIEWFGYTSTAGHLVYYEAECVDAVFWGGT